MPCLGVLLGPAGSAPVSLEHRITAGQQHYFSRAPQFTCRGVPRRHKIARFYSTVASSILWGSCGWTFSSAMVACMETVELSFLRRILAVPKLPGEGFVGYMVRSAAVARRYLVRYKQQGIVACALSRLHGWAGHLARLPAASCLSGGTGAPVPYFGLVA